MGLMASLSSLKGSDDPEWETIGTRLAELKADLAQKKPSPAEAFKAEGNALFKASKYAEAVLQYKLATDADPNVPAYWSNMSASYEKLGDYENAAEAGRGCINADGKFVKGYFRLATALKALDDLDECVKTLEAGLCVDPSHKDLKKLHEEVTGLLKTRPPPLAPLLPPPPPLQNISLFDLLTTQTFNDQSFKLEPSEVKLSRLDFVHADATAKSTTTYVPDCPPNDTTTTKITSCFSTSPALVPQLLSECVKIKSESGSIDVSNAGGYHSPESWICDLSRSDSSGAWTVCKSGERFSPIHELIASSLTLHCSAASTSESADRTSAAITQDTAAPDLGSNLLLRFQNVRFTHDYSFTAVKPEVGKMTTFPGYVPHCVMPHTSKEKRVTLAFNVKRIRDAAANKMTVTGWLNENTTGDYNRLHDHGDCDYAMVFNAM
ncbi:hypothetical protein TrVE_jg11632 [Triparma verrucosa]|uniref:Uncharacterized protein n=1 Tax=Triparma verrucosa TaxID=1606542 RepID=A0A9W7ELC1_9STRA|nr:hypothetical protein TrVE_jg11632 [Triparma verrucosa]